MGEPASGGSRSLLSGCRAPDAPSGSASVDAAPSPRRAAPLLIVVLAAVFGLSGCSGQSKRAEGADPTTPSSIPAELQKCVADDVDSSASLDCQDRLYLESVRSADDPALSDIDDQELVGFARGLCAYAESLDSSEGATKPVFGELVASTSSSWGVSPDAVEAVFRSTESLCPAGYQILRDLPRSQGSIQIELSVEGTGSANITYFLPGGSVSQVDGASLPWSQVVHLSEPEAMSLSVAPIGDAKVGCRIAVGEVVLDEQRVAAEPATCDAATDVVDRAVIKGGEGD